ncbi:MAG: CHAD domain-containing protein [Neomegalonema sp.]|nr:CHAD domain-containing protein [Neomegalonema sp.]
MIVANLRAAIGSDEPEGPHQMRVGLRRGRATLWAGRRLLDAEAMRALGDRARDIGRLVGEVRTLDVLRFETLPKLQAAAVDAIGDEKPLRRLEARLARAAVKPRQILASEKTVLDAALLSFDFDAAARFAIGPTAPKAARRGAIGWARKSIARAAKRVFAHDETFEAMSVESRHELRKDAKRLRYALDGFRPLFPGGALEDSYRAVRRLGNALGSLNDAADVARLREFAPEKAHAAAVEAVISAADAIAMADAPKAAERWRALRDAPRFWKS